MAKLIHESEIPIPSSHYFKTISAAFYKLFPTNPLKRGNLIKLNRTLISAEVWSKTPNAETDFRTEIKCTCDIKEGVYNVKFNFIMEIRAAHLAALPVVELFINFSWSLWGVITLI